MYDVLLRTMVRLGVRSQLIIWIGEALLKRSVALRLGSWTSDRGHSRYHISAARRAWGRVLSFADDVLPYRQGKIRTEIASSLQLELDRIGQWCTEHSSLLQPSKADALWCSLNNHSVKAVMPTVSIDGQELEPVYRVFQYLSPPPPQSIWAMVHMKTVCLQEPISIPDYHASFQNHSAIYLLSGLVVYVSRSSTFS